MTTLDESIRRLAERLGVAVSQVQHALEREGLSLTSEEQTTFHTSQPTIAMNAWMMSLATMARKERGQFMPSARPAPASQRSGARRQQPVAAAGSE